MNGSSAVLLRGVKCVAGGITQFRVTTTTGEIDTRIRSPIRGSSDGIDRQAGATCDRNGRILPRLSRRSGKRDEASFPCTLRDFTNTPVAPARLRARARACAQCVISRRKETRSLLTRPSRCNAARRTDKVVPRSE